MGLLAVGLVSCEDFLTIYPTNRVVEEEFWEDMNDLNGVRYGAYKQMASTVSRMYQWGDLRSDSYKLNTEEHSDQGDRNTYSNILIGMPDSSMSVFDWGGVYRTINLCNKVLKYGPEVLEKDKQFTTTEWYYMRAEMTALRALNYFYLIRAFKDVPYTTKLINSDTEVEVFPLSNQMAILDSIILDCESVAGQARNRFANNSETKGMITNAAIYSMLADMYLWRGSLHQGRGIKNDTVVYFNKKTSTTDSIAHSNTGDYELAVQWADRALEAHHNQITDNLSSLGFYGTSQELISFGLPNVDLVKNEFTGAHQNTTPLLEAQEDLFWYFSDNTSGNGTESILEIQYRHADGQKNTIVNSLYGYSTGTHLMVAEDAIKQAHNDDNNQKYDSRVWIGCQTYIESTQAKAGYYCLKYQNPTPVFEGQAGSRKLSYVERGSTGDYHNWIIYRTTDVMLMKAEALAVLKKEPNTVRAIVNAINRRSYCNYNDGTTLTYTDLSGTVGNMKEAGDLNKSQANNDKINIPTIPGLVVTVMNQRQIELLGEGKRWFDLVRCAERYSDNSKDPADERDNPEGVSKGDPGYVGNGQSGMAAVVYYFMKNSVGQQSCGTLYNRFKNRWGLYCPIYEQEVKASRGVILQNPVWNKSRYEQ